MKLPDQQFYRWELGQVANPFNIPPATDLCNMRGYTISGLTGVVLAIRAHALGTQNLVDSSLEPTESLRRSLSSAVAEHALGLNPNEVEGFIKPDGTSSNRVLLDFARQFTGKRAVVCSSLAHKSIQQAVSSDLKIVSLDKCQGFQMQESALIEALDENVGVLVLTGGTTELGIIEQLTALVEEKCKQLGIWIHLDAAYGGMNLGCLPESYPQREKLRNLAQADLVKSITVCPHKFVGGLGCSIAFLKPQGELPAESYITGANVIAGTTASSEIPFKTDQTIKKLGGNGLQELAERTLKSANYFARALKHFGEVETIVPVQSGIVPIALSSAEDAKNLCCKLRNIGFSIAEPIAIHSDQGTHHGVRIVFTSEIYFDPLALEDLARIISFAK